MGRAAWGAVLALGLALVTAPVLAAMPAPAGVRLVLFLPSDRDGSTALLDGIRRVAIDLQAWSRRQMGGRTFVIASPEVEVCRSAQPSSYFFGAPMITVSQELEKCVPWSTQLDRYSWVVYTPLRGACGAPYRIGAAWTGITIMGMLDTDGLAGQTTVTADCGDSFTFGFDRWTGGLGHELGHAMGLPHPPGCDQQQPGCDSAALMWAGFYDFPNTYLRADDKAALLAGSFYRGDGARAEDRLFNWAEATYPSYFPGRGRVMLNFEGYYYREYPQAQNFVGVRGARVYLYGALTGWEIRDVGALEAFMPAVEAAGF